MRDALHWRWRSRSRHRCRQCGGDETLEQLINFTDAELSEMVIAQQSLSDYTFTRHGCSACVDVPTLQHCATHPTTSFDALAMPTIESVSVLQQQTHLDALERFGLAVESSA